MTRAPYPPDTQQVQPPSRNRWVQTERKAHEEWASLIARKPTAAQVLHHLVARMGDKNAVVISQKTLATFAGVHERTVRRAVQDLVAEKWIQVVKMNGPGTVAAYVVNDRVAWGEKRENLRFSQFSATVIAASEDQDAGTMEDQSVLRQIPTLYPGEQQLPAGPGVEPPAQPAIPGLEPDLPAREVMDRDTGEIRQQPAALPAPDFTAEELAAAVRMLRGETRKPTELEMLRAYFREDVRRSLTEPTRRPAAFDPEDPDTY